MGFTEVLMSLVDPECHPELHGDARRVCAGCFDDLDLKALIRENGQCSRCEFCGTRRAKTVELSVVTERIADRIGTFFGTAVDQLPYDGREAGYQGENFDTYELLQNEIGLELPRDDGDLLDAIIDAVGDDQWCAYDWTRLDIDESLQSSWRSFAETVKHDRRFFFQGGRDEGDDPDDRSPIQLLHELGQLLSSLGRVRTYPAGLGLYRARERGPGERHVTPAALGPPPARFALQSNRMNPPGIPMFYGADSRRLSIDEVRNARVSLARFETTREIRVVDLVDLPRVPGFFSNAPRSRRQHLAFLNAFAREISLPVPRDERTHVDYLPTQVFTEFLRDARLGGRSVDGIRYASATGTKGANFVLFATQRDVIDALPEDPHSWLRTEPWLRLTGVVQRRGSAAPSD